MSKGARRMEFAGVIEVAGTEWSEEDGRRMREDGYLIVSKECVSFECPCGCGDLSSVPHSGKSAEIWALTREADGTITLSPSLQRKDGCKSHFCIKHNRVEWH